MTSLPHNVEPMFSKPGTYKGWDADGHIWHIQKRASKKWIAQPAPNHPGRFSARNIEAPSLKGVAHSLSERTARPAPRPFL